MTITSRPDDPATSTDATFTWSIDGARWPWETCSLDGAEPTPCSSPATYTDLAVGDHTFTVTATRRSGIWASDTARWTILQPAAAPCGSSRPPPAAYDHVVWIVMENHSYDQALDPSNAPYTAALASVCGLATSFTAETHPSLPNYIAMTSGSTQGVTDDAGPSAHPLSGPSIFSQTAGDWRALQESMPTNCALSDAGDYAVRHNPATYYVDIRGECATNDVPLGPTPDLSARFTFVTPNLCNDTHDCAVSTGDAWLATFLPARRRSTRPAPRPCSSPGTRTTAAPATTSRPW